MTRLWLGGAAALVLVLLTGCAQDDMNEVSVTWTIRCTPPEGSVSRGSILMAQSVPTAAAIPCVRKVPEDWSLGQFSADDNGAKFTMSFLGQGPGVTVTLSRRCGLGGATERRSDQRGMRRYDEVIRNGSAFQDSRYYVYPGGCTKYRFNLRGAGAPAQATDVSAALGFVSRDTLRRQVSDRSGGRLHLDPSEAS